VRHHRVIAFPTLHEKRPCHGPILVIRINKLQHGSQQSDSKIPGEPPKGTQPVGSGRQATLNRVHIVRAHAANP
jgi:hypothetical protein